MWIDPTHHLSKQAFSCVFICVEFRKERKQFPYKMNIHLLVRRLIRIFIQFVIGIEQVFGICRGNFRFSMLYSHIVCAILIIMLPVSNQSLYFTPGAHSIVVDVARNLTFTSSWILIIAILVNSQFNSRYKSLKEILSHMEYLICNQNLTENINFLIHITFRLIFILPRVLVLQASIFLQYSKKSESSKSHVIFLLTPYILLMLISNRISVINCILQRHLKLIIKNATFYSLKTLKIDAIKLRELHETFSHHNKLNAINLLAVMSYEMQKISFQVWFMVWLLWKFWDFYGSSFRDFSSICIMRSEANWINQFFLMWYL